MRVTAVKVVYDLLSVCDVVGRDLCGFVVPGPFHSVLQSRLASSATSIPTGIQYVLYFPLFHSFNFNRRRRFLSLLGQWVGSGGPEQVNMEHRVYLH